jgi:hypothetical protein
MMLSVSLDEAIGFHSNGLVAKSLQIVLIIPALYTRLSNLLDGMLGSLREHTRRYGLLPSVEPLNPANFRGQRERRSALISAQLTSILLSQRARFLNKISTLRKMLFDLRKDFCQAAQELCLERGGDERALLWASMDTGQFDLNTCLRELLVLLKCFLRVMPDDHLVGFQKTVTSRTNAIRPDHDFFLRSRVAVRTS